MNTPFFIFGVLLCLMVADARHFGESGESVNTDDGQTHAKPREGTDRHRRKRYHINYGYDYQQPANPFYPPYRREYDRNQDLLPEIYRLLDEIYAYVRRPPPPPQPQPIYIPYAVPYPVCNCQQTTTPAIPPRVNLTNRFPDMDDDNQNWGLVVDEGTEEEEGDGSRPLSFTPIQPKRPLKRPQVQLEHGTYHGREQAAPASQARIPVMCDVFSLSCCGNGSPAQQRECLINNGCPDTYDNGRGCSQEKLLKIIDAYSKAYAPVH